MAGGISQKHRHQPRVYSGNRCTYTPVREVASVNVDDIVFCEVQPNDRFYAHLVSHKYWDDQSSCYAFTISNLAGHRNGWCYIEHIYVKLTDVTT